MGYMECQVKARLTKFRAGVSLIPSREGEGACSSLNGQGRDVGLAIGKRTPASTPRRLVGRAFPPSRRQSVRDPLFLLRLARSLRSP